MNIVRQYIHEKFTQDSDPVHDLGIGIILDPGTIVSLKEYIKTNNTYIKTTWGDYELFSGIKDRALYIGIKGVIVKHKIYKNNSLKLSIAFFGDASMIHEVIKEIKSKHFNKILKNYRVGYAVAPLNVWMEYLNFNVNI